MLQYNSLRRPIHALILLAAFMFSSVPAIAQDSLSNEELRNRAIVREQMRAKQLEAEVIARANMARFEARVADADRQLRAFEEQHAAFAAELEAVLKNDTGRRIAVKNQQAGLVIMDWMDAPLMRDADFARHRSIVDAMETLITERKERPDVAFMVDPDQENRIDDAFLWARDRAARLAERRAWLNEAIGATDPASLVEGVPTLAEAIESFRKARRDLWAAATGVGQTRARDEAEPQMVEAARVAELERLLQETEQRLREARQQMELDRIDFENRLRTREAEALKAAAEAEEARKNLLAEVQHMQILEDANRRLQDEIAKASAKGIEEEAEGVRLRKLAESTSTQNTLRPFTTPGRWQPGEIRPNPAAEVGPMSYSAIVSFGALDQSEEGLRKMLAIVNAKGSGQLRVMQGQGNRRRHLDEMRPKWGFPDRFNDLSGNQIEELREVQTLLAEVGPTMVELGLLAP